MNLKRGIRLIAFVLMLALSTAASTLLPTHGADAQSGGTQTITSPHKTIEFEVPEDWKVTFGETHLIAITNGTTQIFVQDKYVFYGSNATPPYDSAERLLTERASAEQNENATLSEIEINELTFARMDTTTEQLGQLVLLVTILDGDPVMAGAYLLSTEQQTTIPEEDIEVLLAVVGSLRNITEPIPDTLENWQEGWQAIVNELINKALVPASGGQLLFDIPDAYVDGTGLFARMLTDSRQLTHNMILGAEIDFQVPADLTSQASCILETRVDLETDANGYQSGFVAFYLLSSGRLRINTRTEAGQIARIYTDPVYAGSTQLTLTAYLIDDRLTAYVDGQLVAHNILIPDQSGPFLIALDAQSDSVRCDMHVWAYELP